MTSMPIFFIHTNIWYTNDNIFICAYLSRHVIRKKTLYWYHNLWYDRVYFFQNMSNACLDLKREKDIGRLDDGLIVQATWYRNEKLEQDKSQVFSVLYTTLMASFSEFISNKAK